MNNTIKRILVALFTISIASLLWVKFVDTPLISFGSANSTELDFVKAELDSISSRYTAVSRELYQRNIQLYEANQTLARADSIANGGKYTYLVTLQLTSIDNNMVRDTTPNNTFVVVLPVARQFYEAVAVGNVLQAGVDYGFRYGQEILYGKHIAITNKTVVNGNQ